MEERKKLFLDTTIQIDRIFGSCKKRAAIRSVCNGYICCCSKYVLGEFYASIIADTVLVYQVLLTEQDLNEAEKRVAEISRYRQSQRTHMIFIRLRQLFDDQIEEMKCEMESYFDDLLHMFFRGIDPDLQDGTQCQRANAYITSQDNIPVLEGAFCQKRICRCNIERFWQHHQDLCEVHPSLDIEPKVKSLLQGIKASHYNKKGNDCRTLGDAVIILEARDGGGEICTTNRKDFSPLCQLFQVALKVPDYTDVFVRT